MTDSKAPTDHETPEHAAWEAAVLPLNYSRWEGYWVPYGADCTAFMMLREDEVVWRTWLLYHALQRILWRV